MTTKELVDSFVNRHTIKRDHLLRDKMHREIREILREYRRECFVLDDLLNKQYKPVSRLEHLLRFLGIR